MDILQLWTPIKNILKEAYQNAFSFTSFRIIGKTTDNLTKRAIFSIKIKRMPAQIDLTTETIMEDDQYLLGLSSHDRRRIKEQYLLEMKQPLAYIEEYPIFPNENNKYIFKILSLNKRKIICGSASYFINQDKDTLALLSQKDTIKIAMAYYAECFRDTEMDKSRKTTKKLYII